MSQNCITYFTNQNKNTCFVTKYSRNVTVPFVHCIVGHVRYFNCYLCSLVQCAILQNLRGWHLQRRRMPRPRTPAQSPTSSKQVSVPKLRLDQGRSYRRLGRRCNAAESCQSLIQCQLVTINRKLLIYCCCIDTGIMLLELVGNDFSGLFRADQRSLAAGNIRNNFYANVNQIKGEYSTMGPASVPNKVGKQKRNTNQEMKPASNVKSQEICMSPHI